MTYVAVAAQIATGRATIAAIAMDLRRGDVNGPPAARVWREEEGNLTVGRASMSLGTAGRVIRPELRQKRQFDPQNPIRHKVFLASDRFH